MRKSVLVMSMLALLFGCGELLAYLFVRTHPKLFAPDREIVDAALDFRAYREFLAVRYDDELGWQNPRATTMTEVDCLGETKSYTWDAHGARSTGPSTRVDIIAVGDSYTHGHEAADRGTYPYRLQQVTGLDVVNYGVNAFDPLQASLQFDRVAPRHPEARLAVLGVMYENILRIPNAYRGAYRPITQEPFSFKPFIDLSGPEQVVRGNGNAPPARTPEELRARIETALENDYWRLPRASFPYLASVAQALRSRAMLLHLERKIRGVARFVEYHDPNLVHALRHAIERFLASARARGVRPVVVFMPQNEGDRTSPGQLIAALRADHPDALVLNVGDAAIDWDRYNLKGLTCHPSPYGYDQIARYVAAALVEAGLVSPAKQVAGTRGD